MKKILAMLLSVAMLGSTLVACGSPAPTKSDTASTAKSDTASTAKSDTASTAKSDTASTAKSDTTPTKTVKLNVGYMPHYGSLWSLMTAQKKGFFADEGLDVTLTEFQDGPTIIAAMENGSVDFGYIGQGAHKLCVKGKASIVALSQINYCEALIGGPGITSVKDLAGKKVAYSSGTSSEDILRHALAANKMTMNDIQAVDMDAASIVTAMMAHGVDACATWSPNSLTILNGMKGATKLADNRNFPDTISLSSWVATPKYLKKNHDVAVRFVRALFKAMDYSAKEHHDEVAKWVAKQCALDYNNVYAQRDDAHWMTGKEVVAGVKDGTVKGYYTLQQKNLLDSGAITKSDKCPVSNYVAFDIMTEAGNY